MQVQSWDAEDWKRELKKRFDQAAEYRSQFEWQWLENYRFVYTDIPHDQQGIYNLSFDSFMDIESGDVDSGDSDVGINHIYRYIRFWHSQMSANPPAVVVRPTSTDPEDSRRADAADRIARHLRRELEMGEVSDQRNLQTLVFGTGYSKVVQDPTCGNILEFDEETGKLTMTGDMKAYSPSSLDVWIDPQAKRKQDVRWTIERIRMPIEEAKMYWPEHAELLQDHIEERNNQLNTFSLFGEAHAAPNPEEVEVLEYYEKGMPINGMQGRHAYFLQDGSLLDYGVNDHWDAQLPIEILTYVDVPNQVYGKSVIEYASRLQSIINKYDSSVLDTLQAQNVARMAVHENSNLEDEAISNSSWDVIKWSGAQPPHFLNPPQLMSDAWRARDMWERGLQELFGINDAMLGIQRREQSAVSQQTSIESGTMLHRRLFEKYSRVTEKEYKAALGLAQKHWATKRTIKVLGDEKAFLAAEYSSADIAGGFDLMAEYGTSLPLDPNMAREQLMLMMPMLEKSGMSMKKILRMFKLSELETLLDRSELAADRQREIFEEMIAKSTEGEAEYIAPRELQEHQGMLEYAYDYVMSSEFFHAIPPEIKTLIEQHIKEREDLAKQAAAGGQPSQPAPADAGMGGPLGLAVPPPIPGGGQGPA